jgi:CheY-like chemotaxis protein
MCKREDLIVMVVESNKIDLKITCDALERMGITKIICVESYQEAIHTLSENIDIDIVLADYAIEEGKDLGTLLVTFIKKEYPRITIVLLSKEYSCSVVLNSIRMNADDILDKNRDDDIETLLVKWISLAQLKVETREKLYGPRKAAA